MRAKEAMLQAEQVRLEEWHAKLEKRESICADHEEELEERLKRLQRGEVKLKQAMGIKDMRERLPTPSAIEAAQYRKQQELKAMKDEWARRLNELEAAEKDWCEKRSHPYVPALPKKEPGA